MRDRYGPPEVVELRDVERPVATDDKVLVRVRAASVNRADLDGLTPRPKFARLFMGLRAPRDHQVGADVAGVVEAVGPTVTRFKPGDRVFADLFGSDQGAFSEYVCAAEKRFQPIGPDLSFADAATLPHSAILAIQGLRRRNGRTVQPGEKVLVVGASGNVGPFAVQIAKHRGADVTAVCSTAKMDFVRLLGADHVIDYTTTDYTKNGERYDWIIDTDSHNSILRVRGSLKPGGTYVTLGGTSVPIFAALILGSLLSIRGGKWSGLMIWWKPFNPDDVTTLKELVTSGAVKPAIDRHFPLDQVVEALRYVHDGRPKGKVVIDFPDSAEA